MSLDLFRLAGGIDIQNDALTSSAYILQGSGIPGGDSGFQDAAPIGSLYLRTDSSGTGLQPYYKYTTANNTSADWSVIASKQYVDDAIIGLSWREPARVRSTVDTLPTATPGDPITVDSLSITNGQRVLFSNLTANPNVYIYSQSTGTFVQDQNLATAGDALFITEGTSVGNRWTYNGTAWVLFGAQTDVSEITYIDTFIGKSSVGAITPSYTSQYLFSNTASLLTSFNTLETALGVGTITNTGADYPIRSSLAFVGTNGASGTTTITAALDALNTAIGDRNYTVGTNYPILADGQVVTTSIEALNVAVHDVVVGTLAITGSISSTPGTLQTVDTVPLALATEVKWLVQIRETATPGNLRGSEVHAITDGTNVDYTRYAEITLGAGVAGFGLSVSISGTDIILQLKATANYDYSVKRIAVSKF